MRRGKVLWSSVVKRREVVLLATLAALGHANLPGQALERTGTALTVAKPGPVVQSQRSATRSGRQAGTVHSTDSIVGKLIFVPATGPNGCFQGSPVSEPGRHSDESRFKHILTRNLAVMETEVTRGMWAALQATHAALPSDRSWNFGGDDRVNDPAQQVTWYGAVLFANLLSKQQGLKPVYYTDSSRAKAVEVIADVNVSVFMDGGADGFRLPTEGEWEYFARAGTTGPFSIDEPNYNRSTPGCPAPGTLNQLEKVAWFCTNAGNRTHAVGQKGSNPWGLKDVHGNVWEWCWDWYETYPSGPVTDYPKVTDQSSFRLALGQADPTAGSDLPRVMRGGSWSDDARRARSASRDGDPGYSEYSIGFRLVRSVN